MHENFIKMELTAEDKNWAVKKANADLKALEGTNYKSRFNTNKKENEITGNIGEAVFHRWLKINGVEHDWQNNKIGEADDYDFLIDGKKWDVKTIMRHLPVTDLKDNFELGVNKGQVGLHADYYFWVILQGHNPMAATFAYLVGSKSSNRIKEFPVQEKITGAKAYWMPIADALPALDTLNNTMRGC